MINTLQAKYKLSSNDTAKMLGISNGMASLLIRGQREPSESVRVLADIYLNSPGIAYSRLECVIPVKPRRR